MFLGHSHVIYHVLMLYFMTEIFPGGCKYHVMSFAQGLKGALKIFRCKGFWEGYHENYIDCFNYYLIL